MTLMVITLYVGWS